MKRYKHLANVRPQIKLSVFVEFTFADGLFNMGVEYDWLKLNGGKITPAMAAQALDGNSKYGWLYQADSSMPYEASIATHRHYEWSCVSRKSGALFDPEID